MPTTVPTGSDLTTTYTLATADTYTLALGATRQQRSSTSITVSTSNAILDIQGALSGPAAPTAASNLRLINITNNQTGNLIQVSASGSITNSNGDAIRSQSVAGTNNVLNLGAIIVLNKAAAPSVGGDPINNAHAINFTAAQGTAGAAASDITSGGTITNGSTGNSAALIRDDVGDAVRLGAHQTLVNYGTINGNGPVNDTSTNNNLRGTSTATTYGTSRGVRVDDDGSSATSQGFAIRIENYNLITGAQHAIDIGDVDSRSVTVVNAAGANITGRNGSGVGADSTAAAAGTIVVNNSGTITGAYSQTVIDRAGYTYLNGTGDGDGDGVDVDGGATVNNLAGGIIQGTGAGGFDSQGRANASEGISLGGGIINNEGVIIGANTGIVVNNDTNVSRSGVAATTIVNYAAGTITGQAGYAIRFENKTGTAADADSITNYGTITGNGAIPDPAAIVTLQGGAVDTNSTGTLDGVSYTGTGVARFIRGDGSAIQTGQGDDILLNYGTITGNTGRAINLEGGNDAMVLVTGSSVSGQINGGTGVDTMELFLDPRTGADPREGPNSGITTGTLANVLNFERLNVNSGSWTATGDQAFSDFATISAGSTLTVAAGATLALGAGTTSAGALVLNGTLSVVTGALNGSISGTGVLAKTGAGTLTLSTAHTYSGGTTLAGGNLSLTALGAAGTGAITFGAGAQLLTISNAALGAARVFDNSLVGFGTDGDRIDLTGIASTSVRASYDAATGRLALTSTTSATVLALFDVGTALGGAALSIASDGSSGTLVRFVANSGGVTGFGGTNADDNYTGTTGDDFFNFGSGGNDTVAGGAGNDAFLFGAALNAGDRIDGGAGTLDQVGINGNYTGPGRLVLGANTLTNVETLAFLAGTGGVLNSYDVLWADGNATGNAEFNVYGTLLAAGENVTFDGSSETDAHFRMFGGLGTDLLTGSANNDAFYFGPGRWNTTDVVHGGGGAMDQIGLDGTYTNLVIDGRMDVETVALLPGSPGDLNTFSVRIDDSFVPAGGLRTIYAVEVATAVTIDGSGETDGALMLMGGRAGDSILGGGGADTIFGSLGIDLLAGGAGADVFLYDDAAQSTGYNYDRLLDFAYGQDVIRIAGQVHDTFATSTSGTLDDNAATFDAQLGAALNGLLTGGAAVLYTPDAGTLSGHTFLVVDANGIAGYQAGGDYVMEMPGTPPAPVDFIIA